MSFVKCAVLYARGKPTACYKYCLERFANHITLLYNVICLKTRSKILNLLFLNGLHTPLSQTLPFCCLCSFKLWNMLEELFKLFKHIIGC